MTLTELNKGEINGFFLTDKGGVHNYLPVYDKLFLPFRDAEINIFEVGYLHGGSCKLWERYFSKAIIKSIDVDCCVPPPVSDRIILELRDMRNTTPAYFNNFPPTIAIDDGSHLLEDQIHFIQTVYPVIKSGGMLIIEDVQNLEKHKIVFESLHIPFEVFDLRHVTGRYDDVLIVYYKK
jgi:hypothetical protein